MTRTALSFSRLSGLSLLAALLPLSPILAKQVDLASESAEVEVTTTTNYQDIWLTENSYSTAIGDLNGDNELDLVVGAAGRNSDSPARNGAVYVLYGPLASSPLNLASTDADVLISGAATSDRLGYSVAVGDVNDDGDADLVVASERQDGPSGTRTDAGAVYVFFGPLSGANLDVDNADVTIYGADAGDLMAQSIAIGDVSGDAKKDLVIATRYSDGYGNSHGTETGEAHIFFSPLSSGTIDLNTTAANAVIYGKNGDNFGFSLAIGDVSGDGNGDLAIGAIWANINTPHTTFGTGEVQVIYGPIANNTTINLQSSSPSFRFIGTGTFDYLGYDVAIGDINADGDPDLVGLAGRADTPTIIENGAAFVAFGPLSGSSKTAASADATVFIPDSSNATGLASSLTLGDLSFDGIPDLVIGSRFSSGPDDNRNVAGEVAVIYGPLQARTYDLNEESPNQNYFGASGFQLGSDVQVGDLNGDDVNDLISMAHFAPSALGSAGEVYVFSGVRCSYDNFEDGTLQASWTLAEFGDAGSGAATETGGYLDLQGDGTGYSGSTDNMVYLYREGISGDFRVEVTLLAVPENQGGTFRRGGLLLRSTDTPPPGFTAAQAPNLSVNYSPAYIEGGTLVKQLRFRYRENWGDGPPDENFASRIAENLGNTFTLPVRIAIERKAGQFAVFYSKNQGRPRWSKVLGGLATQSNGGWAPLPNLGTAPSIGLVTTSNHATTTATFRFDDFSACRP